MRGQTAGKYLRLPFMETGHLSDRFPNNEGFTTGWKSTIIYWRKMYEQV